jgi:hypothetical protein
MNIALIVLLMACVAVVFSVIGSPLPFVRKDNQCYTAWGFKLDCSQVGYTSYTDNTAMCSAMQQQIDSIAAWEIIGICASTAAVVFVALGMGMKRPLFRWLAIGMGALAAASFTIVVGLEGGIYTVDVCTTGYIYRDQSWWLGSGFALEVIAWVDSLVYPALLYFIDPGFHD